MSKDAETEIAEQQVASTSGEAPAESAEEPVRSGQPSAEQSENAAQAEATRPEAAQGDAARPEAVKVKRAEDSVGKQRKMSRTLIAQTVVGILFSLAVLAVLVYFVFVGVPTL
ncbi:hypothetical protein [Corynebacterium urogenitale]